MPNPLVHERILVTGGSGFIGQHLLRALVESGCRPVAVTRSSQRLRVAPDLRTAVRWVEIDWDDSDALEAILQAESPSTIFHLAGVRIPDREKDAADRNWQGNVVVTENLLRGLLPRTDIRRFVAIGSAEEYGSFPADSTDGEAAKPQTSYGKAKAAVTKLIMDRFATGEFPGLVLRPFSVYGPLQPRQMFVAQAIEHAVSETPFAMTEGLQKRDLVYVTDLVRALIAAETRPVEGKLIDIGAGISYRLRDVAEQIWKLTGSSAPLQIGARPAPPDELHDTCANLAQARDLLDWEPLVDLESGLRQTIQWEREWN